MVLQGEAARVRDRIGSMMADGNIASVKLTKARKSYSCDGQRGDGRCAANLKAGDEYVRVTSYPHASRDGGYTFRTSYVICLKCAGVQ